MNIEKEFNVGIAERIRAIIKIGYRFFSSDAAIRGHRCNIDHIPAMILPVILTRSSVH
jgi:hypothetical protein